MSAATRFPLPFVGLALALTASLILPAVSRADDLSPMATEAPRAEPTFPNCLNSDSGCPVSDRGSVDWTKIPPVRPTPRLGMYVLFPTGPGYYSLLDQVEGNYVSKAPNLPWGTFAFYPGSTFDLDFRYLDKPDNQQHDFFDPLKRIHCGDDWLLSFGGQTWIRTMNEVDSRLTTVNNNYQLLRTRFYSDLWYRDRFRIFAEYLYADAFNFDLNPLPIDISRNDMLNLFVDMKLLEANGPAYLRVGRQELLYGSQRLISPLEWANTRRTFQGVKAFHIGKEWDLDCFWVQPVRVDRNDFDSVDNNINFAGAWATRKLRPGNGRDFYYLFLDNTNPAAVGQNQHVGSQTIHTLGTRWYGDWNNWLYEAELMFQLGTFSNQNKVAASTPAGLGYFFKERSWKPQVWCYFDWASGDADPGQGRVNSTFNPLFPFGHYYYGYLDLVNRQNIIDPYFQFVCFPENWLTLQLQLHNFWLASNRDALFSAGGVPLRRSPTGSAGSFVGNELDLLMVAQLTHHTNFAVGWSKLYSGEFIRKTGPDVSPELLYIQVSYRW